jgi:hypothetical protein
MIPEYIERIGTGHLAPLTALVARHTMRPRAALPSYQRLEPSGT